MLLEKKKQTVFRIANYKFANKIKYIQILIRYNKLTHILYFIFYILYIIYYILYYIFYIIYYIVYSLFF